jgi:DNA repair exonuclease SbcCD ATPase subunit
MADENTDQEPVVEAEGEVKLAVDDNQHKYDSLAKTIRKTKETFAKEIAALKEQLTVSKAAGTATPEDEDDINVQLKKYKKEVDKLSRTLDEEKKTAQAEKDRNAVFATLNELGVLGSKPLYNHLKAENMISKDEDGNLVFRSEKNGVEKPLQDGVKEWLSTSEGKMFMPASGASGSGATQRQGIPAHKQNGALTREEKKAAAMSQFMDILKGK